MINTGCPEITTTFAMSFVHWDNVMKERIFREKFTESRNLAVANAEVKVDKGDKVHETEAYFRVNPYNQG